MNDSGGEIPDAASALPNIYGRDLETLRGHAAPSGLTNPAVDEQLDQAAAISSSGSDHTETFGTQQNPEIEIPADYEAGRTHDFEDPGFGPIEPKGVVPDDQYYSAPPEGVPGDDQSAGDQAELGQVVGPDVEDYDYTTPESAGYTEEAELQPYDESVDDTVHHLGDTEQPTDDDEREAQYQNCLEYGHAAYESGDNSAAIYYYASAMFAHGDNSSPHEMIDLPESFGDRVALVEQVEQYVMPRNVNKNRAPRVQLEKLDIGYEGQERAHLSGHLGEQPGLNVTFTYPLGGELNAILWWPDGREIDGSIDQYTADVESRGEDFRNVAKVAELLNLAVTLGRPLSPEEYGEFSTRERLQATRLYIWNGIKSLSFSRMR